MGALLILPVRSAVSEVYIAGQVGANIPDLSDTQSSLECHRQWKSPLVANFRGVRWQSWSYFFNSMKWLGVKPRTSMLSLISSIKTGPSAEVDLGTLPGISIGVLTWGS